jgi:hypothetical protein
VPSVARYAATPRERELRRLDRVVERLLVGEPGHFVDDGRAEEVETGQTRLQAQIPDAWVPRRQMPTKELGASPTQK